MRGCLGPEAEWLCPGSGAVPIQHRWGRFPSSIGAACLGGASGSTHPSQFPIPVAQDTPVGTKPIQMCNVPSSRVSFFSPLWCHLFLEVLTSHLDYGSSLLAHLPASTLTHHLV